MASETQVPLFWHGAARQGAHFDIRLISTGPEDDNGGTWEQEENVGIQIRGSRGASVEKTHISCCF